MSVPEGIPADIWEAASLAADFIETEITDLVDWDSRAGITMMVATAILAERERCAKIAERDVDWTAFSRQPQKDYRGDETNAFAMPDDEHLPTPGNVFAYTNGLAAGRVIAALIRTGDARNDNFKSVPHLGPVA